jgi:surfactin synthase thioesterase subunit
MSEEILQTRWIAGKLGNVNAKVRLFCFGHAGSGGAFFFSWRAALLPEIEVCPVVLPGRENRIGEASYHRIDQLIEPLFSALVPLTGKPFALFGHSVGAVIAYEVARRFAASYVPAPLCLFVSARRAPRLPARRQPFFGLADQEFLAAVSRMNGMRPELLEYPEVLQLFLPSLRADFEMNDTYTFVPGPPLSCPVIAFVGDNDFEAHPSEMSAWAEVTDSEFLLRVFAGDHFYHKDAPPALFSAIREGIQQAAVIRPGAAPAIDAAAR